MKLKRVKQKDLATMQPSVLSHYARKMRTFNSFDPKLMRRASENLADANVELKNRGLEPQ